MVGHGIHLKFIGHAGIAIASVNSKCFLGSELALIVNGEREITIIAGIVGELPLMATRHKAHADIVQITAYLAHCGQFVAGNHATGLHRHDVLKVFPLVGLAV